MSNLKTVAYVIAMLIAGAVGKVLMKHMLN